MRAVLAAALLMLQAATSPPTQTAKGTIAGGVVRADTGAPVAGAHVTLMRFIRISNEFSGAEPAGSTDTDAQGRFVFRDVDPGGYFVQAAAADYIAHAQGHVPPGAPAGAVRSAMVMLQAGQSISDVLFRATPVGYVTGRIVNAAGRPLAGMTVLLFRRVYGEGGRLSFANSGETTTDDRGEYRVSAMPYDAYYVFARMPYGPPGSAPPDRYAAALLPGTVDPDAAATVAVRSGDSRTMSDLVLEPLRLYTIRGRVVDGATGQPPRDAAVGVSPTSIVGAETIAAQPSYNAADGSFEAHVGPGRYAISASLIQRGPLPLPTAGPIAMPPVAREALVTVSNRDVDGVVLTFVRPDASLRVRLTVDGRPLSSMQEWERSVRVRLDPSRDGVAWGLTGGGGLLPDPMVNLDGTLQLFGPTVGQFRVRVSGLPDDAYVKEMRFGSADALEAPLQISGPTTEALDVAIVSAGGRVDATALNDRRPVADAEIVLVPDQRSRTDLFKASRADRNGSVSFRGVPPGTYKAFAWSGTDPFAYFDPAVLKRVETSAIPVRVAESARIAIEVPFVPSR